MKQVKKIKLELANNVNGYRDVVRDNKTGFPLVTSLVGLERGIVYTTYNYALIKNLTHNRGEDYSPQKKNKRSNEFIKLVNNNKFHWRISHCMINEEGECIDGNGKFICISSLNEPLNFTITDENVFNDVNPSNKLNAVSEFATNSSWQPKDNYLSALNAGELVAVEIDRMRNYFCAKYQIKKTILTPSRFIAVATKNLSGLAGQGQKRATYCNKEVLESFKTKEFADDFNLVIKICRFALDHTEITPFFILRNVLPILWDKDKNLTHDTVYKLLTAKDTIKIKRVKTDVYGFRVENKMKAIRSEVVRLLGKNNIV